MASGQHVERDEELLKVTTPPARSSGYRLRLWLGFRATQWTSALTTRRRGRSASEPKRLALVSCGQQLVRFWALATGEQRARLWEGRSSLPGRDSSGPHLLHFRRLAISSGVAGRAGTTKVWQSS